MYIIIKFSRFYKLINKCHYALINDINFLSTNLYLLLYFIRGIHFIVNDKINNIICANIISK